MTDQTVSSVKTGFWLLLLTGASLLTTFALACATPFAAFGALAALHMRRGEAALLMSIVWLASQVVGFGFLHYPQTANAFIWGGALLVCALAGMEGAGFAARRLSGASLAVCTLAALAAAMMGFKAAIYAFGMELGGNGSALAPQVVFNFAWTNAVAFVGLLLLYQLGSLLGLVSRSAHARTQLA
jgi:hypothetical protein